MPTKKQHKHVDLANLLIARLGLLVSLAALVVAVAALAFSGTAYCQVTKPETDRVRTADQIDRAYERLAETETLVKTTAVAPERLGQWTAALAGARESLRAAERLWMNRNYNAIEGMVTEAFGTITVVQREVETSRPPPPADGGLPVIAWVGIAIGIAVVVGAVGFTVMRRKGT